MEDAGVRLKHLIGSEVALNHRVSAQRHNDGSRGRAEESGKICGGVRKPSSLVPLYQGDNLLMIAIGLFL